MTFSRSSRIARVSIICGQFTIDGVWCHYQDAGEDAHWDYQSRASGLPFTPVLHGQNAANMALLQNMWANGEMRGEDGRAITPRIIAGESGAPADWTEYLRSEFVNPLDANWHSKYQNAQKFRGFVKNAGEVIYPSGGAPPRAEFQASIGAAPIVQSGRGWVRVSDYWLLGLDIANGGVTSFDLTTPIPRSVGIGDIGSFAPIVAMRAWLDSIKSPASLRIGSDASAANSWTNRDFNLSGLTFEVAGIIASHPRFDLLCRIKSGNYIRASFESAMSEYVEVSGASGDITTLTRLGNLGTPIHAERLVMPQGLQLRVENGGLAIYGADSDGSYALPLGSQRILDYADLTAVAGASGKRWTPSDLEQPLVGHIRYTGAGGDYLRIRKPDKGALYPGVVKEVQVSRDGSGAFHIEDWNGNRLLSPRPSETATIRWLYDRAGNGRAEIVNIIRYESVLGVDTGTLVAGSCYSFDENTWARLMPPPTSAIRRDDDAFAIGASAPAGNQIEWSAANIEASSWLVSTLRDGYAHFRQTAELRKTGTPGGTLVAGARVALYILQHGGQLTKVQEDVLGQAFDSAFPGRTLRWEYRGEVKKGDLFVPVFLFAKGSGYGTGNLTCELFSRTMELTPDLRVDA